MVKTANKRSTRANNTSLKPIVSPQVLGILRILLLVALSVVIFYPPFLRGLYFETEQLPAEICVFFIFLAFWIYKILKRDKRFLDTPVDYAAFGFVLVYFISIFVAVGTRQAIGEWLKYCMYFAIFLMLSDLATTYRSRTAMLWVIIASALGVSFIGIDGAAGERISKALNAFFKAFGAKHDTFFGTFVGGRINSTLQYPNALAAYLMAVYFVCLGVMTASSKVWIRLIAGASSYILIVTFMLTMSRGAYLFLPIAAVLFVVLLPKGNRVRGVVFAIPSLAGLGATVVKLSGYMANAEGNESNIWFYTMIGIAISFVAALIVSFAIRWLEMLDWKVYAALSVLVVAAGVAGVVLMITTKIPLELAHSLEQADSVLTVRRSVELEPEKEYKLVMEVEAQNSAGKPNTYIVNIASRNFAGIIEAKDTPITTFEGKASNGIEKQEIKFKVPTDSRTVSFSFINQFQGTKAVFHSAKVVPVDQSSKIEEIPLKYKYIPESFYSRFDETKETKSGIERTIFYKDGMKIFKDHWLLGAGGGGWQLLNFSYQSYLYWSTQAHNYFVQIAVECGVLGLVVMFLLFIAIGLVLINGLRYRNAANMQDSVLQAGLFAAIAAMFMHSAIDFDLSLSAVFLVLWQFIALFNSMARNRQNGRVETEAQGELSEFLAKLDVQGKMKRLSLHPAIGIVIAMVLMIFPITFLAGTNYARAASEALEQDNISAAVKNMKKAADTDSFMPNYKIDYANLVIKQDQKAITQKDLQTANKYAEQAEKAARHNVDTATRLGIYYLATGVIDKGLANIDKATELRPLRPEEWQQKADAYMQVAMYYLQQGDTTNAESFFDKIMGIENKVREVNKKNMIPFVLNSTTQEILERVRFIKDNSKGEKEVDLGKVVFYALSDMDVNFDGIPDQWNTTTPGEVKLRVTGGKILAESVPGKAGFMQSRALNLQAGKTYRVEVELEGSAGTGIPFAVAGVAENQELKLVNGVYTGEFSVPAEFKRENNTLWLGVNRKYEIKAVRVMVK